MLLYYRNVLYDGFSRVYHRFIYRNLINIPIINQIFNSFNVRYFLFYGILILIGTFWLYYELGYVSPVCAYYTGPVLPPILNKFKTIGRTYRPTIYMFSSYFQWIYLILYCKIEILYRRLTFYASSTKNFVLRLLYGINSYICSLILRTFLFSKIFRSQATVTLREVIEGHNGAVVVLDWYMPRWIVPKCSRCNLPRFDDYSTSNTSDIHPKKAFSTRVDDLIKSVRSDSIGRRSAENSRTNSGDYEFLDFDLFNDGGRIDAKSPSSLNDVTKRSGVDGYIERGEESGRSEAGTGIKDGGLNPSGDGSNVTFSSLPHPKIVRGVMVIVGDVNVSYSICYQPVVCKCNYDRVRHNDESGDNNELCGRCWDFYHNDNEGLCDEPPFVPTIRSLINDAIQNGFICVHVHLNVNLGMANEAFPGLIGLRCFPVSLYSDVIIDLDCAIDKISEKFPDLPIVTIGISFGSNILLEYILSSPHNTPHTDDDYTDLGILLCKEGKITPLSSISGVADDDTGTYKSTMDYRSLNLDSNQLRGNLQNNDENLNGDYKIETNVVFPQSKNSGANSNKSKISAVACINLNLKPTNNILYNLPSANDNATNLYKKFCITTFITQLWGLFNQIHCKKANKELKKDCPIFRCCHYSSILMNYNILKKLYIKIWLFKYNFIKDSIINNKIDNIISLLHKIYNQSYTDMENDSFVNYGDLYFKRYGAKSSIDFKLCILSISRHNIDKFVNDGRNKMKSISESPVYIRINRRIDTKIKIGDDTSKLTTTSVSKLHYPSSSPVQQTSNLPHLSSKKVEPYSSLHMSTSTTNQIKFPTRLRDEYSSKYISNAINTYYRKNINKINNNLDKINIPTLFLYSMDNSLFNWSDIDIFNVLKFV